MGFVTILLFLFYCFGLGFTASFFLKNSENFLERNLMRLGLGLALLPFLGVVLNIAKIPADWRLILALSLVFPIYYLIKNFPNLKDKFTKIKLKKSDISIFVMLIIFVASFYVYGTGAFNYPYLEDDDSWGHAETVKYISVEKNVFNQEALYARYTNPYPPTYNLILGILHQSNDSVFWTLKFFNALIVSLSVIFFYFFVKEFIGNRNKALFATFALASIPAFLSHFIWALALSVPMYFVTFYAVERIKYDKKWWLLSGLVMFTTLTSSPTHSAYFVFFFALYFITKAMLERKVLVYHALAGILGALLSFGLWWLPMFTRYGFLDTLKKMGISVDSGNTALSIAGTADRVYSFSDFFFAQKQNMINNPIGIGIFLSILGIVGIIFFFVRFRHLLKKENHWLVITLVWFLFTFYAVNAAQMPIKLSPFRVWMLLAIPVCILASEGAFNLMGIAKKFGNYAKYGLLIILIIGIFFTSTQQKIAVNTATWPAGAFWTYVQDETGRVFSPELEGYLWMKDNISPNANVFGFTINGPIIGMDQFICYWCEDIREFKRTGVEKSAEETHSFLQKKGYGYLIIGGNFAKKFGANKTNTKLEELVQSGLFTPVFRNQGAVIFRV
jgi:hypothetical protein|tara:strand:- start:26 stop:1873 length:1848 start_codon:yes stop_codon:yes gene_type:complete